MHNVLLISVFVLVVAFKTVSPVCGGEITLEQLKTRTLAWALKNSLKTYLKNSDFLLLKHKKITEIRKMDEQTFSAKYASAWRVLKKCPALTEHYHLTPDMTRDQCLKIMGKLSLQDCLESVESVPDEVLVEQFEQCVHNPEREGKSLKEQMDFLAGQWLTQM